MALIREIVIRDHFLPFRLRPRVLHRHLLLQMFWWPIADPTRTAYRSRQRETHLDSVVQVKCRERIPREPEEVVVVIRVCWLIAVAPHSLIRWYVLPRPQRWVRYNQPGGRIVVDRLIGFVY